jgi:hypothetical protein
VPGYLAPRVIMTREAAQALAGVQAELLPYNMSLKASPVCARFTVPSQIVPCDHLVFTACTVP